MQTKRVKDLMLPLEEYAVVPPHATILEALQTLEKAQVKLPAGRHKHRAVLVVDSQGRVVGKLGHLGFLKALEPKYDQLGDLQLLSRSGFSESYLTSMMRSLSFWQESLPDLCRRARSVRVEAVMRPVTESIDENAPLTEAIHRIVVYQTLSLLVTRDKKVVGILRLSDLFTEVAHFIIGSAPQD